MLGDPCERRLTYEQLNWKDKLLPAPEVQAIFDIGNMVEQLAVKWLQDAGIKVYSQQTPFEDKKSNVTGSIDFKIDIDGKLYPCEVKSVSPYIFDKLNSLDDMLHSRYVYHQRYPAQIQTYLFLAGEDEGVMILVNKTNGKRKIIWVILDVDYVDNLLKKAERINRCVKDNVLPEQIEYSEEICGHCDFRHICIPDTKQVPLEMDDSPALLELLNRRAELQPLSKEYDDVDSEIKEMVKGRDKVACGDYLIIGKNVSATRYDVPKDVKEQYAKQLDYWKVNIVNLKATKKD